MQAAADRYIPALVFSFAAANGGAMSASPGYRPYEPQLHPVAWDKDIWTVDGPEMVYTSGGVAVPCPTRMTMIRLSDGRLWLHSPVVCAGDLVSACTALGPVAAIIAPNPLHCAHIGDWARMFPEAALFAAPGTDAGKLPRDFGVLASGSEPDWRAEIDIHVFALGHFSEAVFFHRASRTLVVTDMMQNFEASRVRSWFARLVLQAVGATGPNGRPSAEIRLAVRRHRQALREGVAAMIAWQPERIILAHGQCYRKAGVREIERAFDWLG